MSAIDYSLMMDINWLTKIDYYQLTSIFIDYWFYQLIAPGSGFQEVVGPSL